MLQKMLWTTAWRNLWRNRRRTAIIITAIVVGMLGIVFYISFVNAWWRQTVENAVGILTSHVQVRHIAYSDNPQLKFNLPFDPSWRDKLKTIDRVTEAGPRIKAMVLFSNSEKSEMGQLIGTEPELEPGLSMIPRSIIEGQWLGPDDKNKIVIGKEMARRFKTKLGRRIILRGTDPDGQVVDAVFRVVGVFETGLKSFDQANAYVRLTDAQAIFGMEGKVTEWAVATVLPEDAEAVAALLPTKVDFAAGGKLAVFTWKELNPLVVKMMEYSVAMMWFFNMFFYLAMAFGVANTMLMSVLERTREIGMMLALGVRRSMILSIIIVEALLMSIFAAVIGAALAGGIVAYYGKHGINLTAWIDGLSYAGMRGIVHPYLSAIDVVLSIGVTAVVAVLVALYPAWKASRLNPTDAMRQG
jgi:ABC-type lipoprotein release transport system permease subunit